MKSLAAAAMLSAAILTWATTSYAADTWVEGRHYFRVQPAQRTQVGPGKVEVAEAISYGCPACNRYLPIIADLKKRLPAQAQVVYVHASFNAQEQWPMFQRAFYTATAMGLVPKTHEAMFKAVWESDELAVVDVRSGALKKPPPTLEDVAKFYQRVAGTDPAKFLATAKSFSIDLNVKRADDWIKAAHVDQTPTFVINGKYRVTDRSAGGIPQLLEVVEWLVTREVAAVSASATPQ
jgi:protein dithiol oxidoreductase (disulfide-forming)